MLKKLWYGSLFLLFLAGCQPVDNSASVSVSVPVGSYEEGSTVKVTLIQNVPEAVTYKIVSTSPRVACPDTVSFDGYVTSKTIELSIVDNDIKDGNTDATVRVVGTGASVTLRVIDNDTDDDTTVEIDNGIIIIEEAQDRTPEAAQILTSPRVRKLMDGQVYVFDDDSVDQDGNPVVWLQPFINRAEVIGLPCLFVVKDSKVIGATRLPPTVDATVQFVEQTLNK